jgi:putative cardiolipin synthase
MNLDPRSVLLNTEIGLLIRSPELASQVEDAFGRDMAPENSWRVKLDESGRIYWQSEAGSTTWQPARSGWQRVLDWLIPGSLIEKHL